MESQAQTNTIADVVARMRPEKRLLLLQHAYALFERLLGNLLLLGSSDLAADVERLERELERPGIRECAATYVYEHEFGHIVATVARHGLDPVDAQIVASLWPVKDLDQREIVAELVRLIQAALPRMALAKGGEELRRMLIEDNPDWPVVDGYEPPPRKKGRPVDPVQRSLIALGVREGIFRDGARPFDEVAATIAVVSSNQTKKESIYRLMKAVRQEYPVPEEWQETLLCERVSLLRSEVFSAPAGAPAAEPPLVENWKKGNWAKRPR